MKEFAKKIMNWFRSREEGFTLAELLVVVGIVVGLAAVILPNVGRFTGEGQRGALATELSSVQTAMDAYASDGNAIQATTTYVNDFSAGVTLPKVPLADPANPYLRLPNGVTVTTGLYCWDLLGTVIQSATAVADTTACP